MPGLAWLRERARRARLSDHAFPRWAYERARLLFRSIGRVIWILHLGWVDSVRRIAREDDGWVVEGWAYHRGTDFGTDRRYRAWLARGLRKIELPVEPIREIEVRAGARAAEHDYSWDAYRLRVPDEVMADLPANGPWHLHLEIRGNGHRVRGPGRRVSLSGGAAFRRQIPLGDGRVAGPVVEEGRLTFATEERPAVAQRVRWSHGSVTAWVEPGVRITSARVVARDQEGSATVTDDDGGTARIDITLPEWESENWYSGADREAWSLEVTTPTGRTPLTVGPQTVLEVDPSVDGRLETGARHEVEIVVAPVRVVVDEVRVDPDERVLHLSGSHDGSPDLRLVLRSRFVNIPVEVTSQEDGRFAARAPLRLSRWGGPELPPPIGTYALVARVGAAAYPTELTADVGEAFPVAHEFDEYRLRLSTPRRPQLAVRFGPPRTEEEYGSWRQNQLRERFTVDTTPEDAVYFESFFGRNATCNPRAMDAEVALHHPELPRYWGVQDLSVAVPAGATPLVRGTTEWWRVRHSARWVVTNEWLRGSFVKQPFQTVLQTWHGSMYKQIGLDRGGRGKAHLQVVRQELDKWDLFVSQAAETTPIIRRAYGLGEQVIETGYPRNDELYETDEATVAALRQRLGIEPDVKVVMYAPTWRESVQEDVELLDLTELGEVLGEGFMLLRRGHVRTLGGTYAAEADNVLDVSTYPQINDLLRVADVLVTDYSSMMFDFSVTGRPMVFYTPDIDQYNDPKVRGSYFDLEERAPGPVTREVDEVVRLLRDVDAWAGDYAERYRAWQERYNTLDDGHASQRAVEALLAHRPSDERVPIGPDADPAEALPAESEGIERGEEFDYRDADEDVVVGSDDRPS